MLNRGQRRLTVSLRVPNKTSGAHQVDRSASTKFGRTIENLQMGGLSQNEIQVFLLNVVL